jgi:hypothetical protein
VHGRLKSVSQFLRVQQVGREQRLQLERFATRFVDSSLEPLLNHRVGAKETTHCSTF